MPAFIAKLIALAQAFGDDENVTENDGRVEAEPADWLEGDFGREFGSLDELDESMFLLESAILG